MKKHVKGLISATLAAVMIFCVGACSDATETTEIVDDNPIKLTKKYNGEEISFLPSPIASYLAAKTEKEQAKILNRSEFSACYGLNAEFCWKSDEVDEYIVHFSKNGDFSDESVARSFSTSLDDFGVLSELMPGRKY